MGSIPGRAATAATASGAAWQVVAAEFMVMGFTVEAVVRVDAAALAVLVVAEGMVGAGEGVAGVACAGQDVVGAGEGLAVAGV